MRMDIACQGEFHDTVSERRMVAKARGILLDWDGCVAIGNRILPEARRFIVQARDRIAILSNNSTHLPEDIAAMLEREGISLPIERIIMAGSEAVLWAHAQPHARTMLFASPRIKAYARSLGLELVREAPDMVLLMRDTRFTYSKLERAVHAVQEGARLVAANADRTHPGPRNQLVPETGALLAAITSCVADLPVTTIGKPGPLMFEKACAALDIRTEDAIMIGDNPETDGAGARALGIWPILVGSPGGTQIGHLVE